MFINGASVRAFQFLEGSYIHLQRKCWLKHFKIHATSYGRLFYQITFLGVKKWINIAWTIPILDILMRAERIRQIWQFTFQWSLKMLPVQIRFKPLPLYFRSDLKFNWNWNVGRLNTFTLVEINQAIWNSLLIGLILFFQPFPEQRNQESAKVDTTFNTSIFIQPFSI